QLRTPLNTFSNADKTVVITFATWPSGKWGWRGSLGRAGCSLPSPLHSVYSPSPRGRRHTAAAPILVFRPARRMTPVRRNRRAAAFEFLDCDCLADVVETMLLSSGS